MKKVLLMVSGIVLCTMLWSVYPKQQQTDASIPASVLDSFAMKYSHPTHVKWENYDRVYKVTFLIEGQKKEATFLFTGDLIYSGN